MIITVACQCASRQLQEQSMMLTKPNHVLMALGQLISSGLVFATCKLACNLVALYVVC